MERNWFTFHTIWYSKNKREKRNYVLLRFNFFLTGISDFIKISKNRSFPARINKQEMLNSQKQSPTSLCSHSNKGKPNLSSFCQNFLSDFDRFLPVPVLHYKLLIFLSHSCLDCRSGPCTVFGGWELQVLLRFVCTALPPSGEVYIICE